MSEIEHKRPYVALLGEFSAGKSTLANLLLGSAQSPVRVTATQMPPLWYHFGTGAPMRVLDDGSEEVLPDAENIAVPLDGTKALKIALDAPTLERFDLLDMPGSSDPNMSPDIWDGLLPMADIAIWCSPATQAWRQSEAAIWEGMPERLHRRSLLLLTRMDKVSAQDRSRVLSRVRRETKDQFRHVLPAALLSAASPIERCEKSGLAEVMTAINDLLLNATAVISMSDRQSIEPASASNPTVPRRVTTLPTAQVNRQRRRSTASSALI